MIADDVLLAWFNGALNIVSIGIWFRVMWLLGDICHMAKEGLQLLRELRSTKDDDEPLRTWIRTKGDEL